MIRFKNYSERLRRLDLRKVFESTVFGPTYTFNAGGQDIIDRIIYENRILRGQSLKKIEKKVHQN